MRLINFLAHTDRDFKQTNGLSLDGCNAVHVHCSRSVNCIWTFWLRTGDVAPACCAVLPRYDSNPSFHTGEVQVLYAFGKIAAALCKFTGTLTLICRVVARLCTIIHVLLHQPSSSSYSLSSSFSFIPFIPSAFCVVSIYTLQCCAVSKVPTNVWQGRVKSTMKCDKRNRERESSKCGMGKQIEEITTSKKVSCIKNSKLLCREERVINNFLRDRVRVMCVVVMVRLCITVIVQAGSRWEMKIVL